MSPSTNNTLCSHSIPFLPSPSLTKMLEEDEDRLKEKIAEEESEKMAEAKRAYEGFVRKKDMIRIRMPDEPERVVGGHWKPPRLDFSKNGVVRKKQVRSYERVES